MKNGISLKDAKQYATIHLGRPIISQGFESREIGGHVVNTLFYKSVNFRNETEFRMTTFVDGKARTGDIL